MIETLTTTVTSLQMSLAELQKDMSSSSSGAGGFSEGQRHQDHPPRFQKMDFPRYDGKSDPLIFVNRCESYFHQQRIREEEKVWMASYNLEEGAQMWYIQVQQDEGTPSWRRFKEMLNLHYGPPLHSAPLADLADRRRTSTVAEYQDHFQALLPRAGPLDESQRVQLFTGGLQPPLSLNVRIQNPQTPAAAMSLARQFEMREQFTSTTTRAPGHNRVCKRLFLLNGVEEEDDRATEEAAVFAAKEEAPMLSLQALAGVAFSDMMQLEVQLGSASLVALLDSGSTHNFISEAAALRTGLHLQHRPRLTAMVATY
ncbi:uncharacterized protein LOC120640239 [Panicum virgatum]|uniref:uncharacterized protein LOC120640239 n=1 Tax=Panicum virgatum TaxID=38727 RepID=UPI0019D63744|nr:uncharacterized protein LOC120640239 [Panicum virgatum]